MKRTQVETRQVVRAVTTQDQARGLAARLRDPLRVEPVVVVSTAAGEREPYVDVDGIAAAVGDLAEVTVIPTGEVSWAFSYAMPPMTQVYGGASRVYPVELSWVDEPSRSPLRFAFGLRDREKVTELVISDALGMALDAGLLTRPASTEQVLVSGTVMGVRGGRALVRTDGGVVAIWPELTVAGVAADRLFIDGMAVSGGHDREAGRLDVRTSLLPLATLLQGYAVGSVALGRVARVDAGGCHIELVPGCRVFVDRVAAVGGADVPLTALMSVGEIVSVRVLARGEVGGKGWKLTLTGIDPDEPTYAAALLDGGPPWLVLPEPEPEPELVEPEVVAPEVGLAITRPEAGAGDQVRRDALGAELEAVRHERDGFRDELVQVEGRVAKLERDRDRLRTQLRTALQDADRASRRARDLEASAAVGAGDGRLFADPAEQLDFEIRLAWARRTAPGEKSGLPLCPYRLGESFLASWAAVDGIDRQKVIDVLVDVLTGRVYEVNGRDAHQLRVSEAGRAPGVTRADGATCWRVSLQHKAPQARRLHFWRLVDGTVELSSVRLHDDFRP